MSVRKLFHLFLSVALFWPSSAWADPKNELPPFEYSEICRRTMKGTQSELAKLLCLMGRIWNTDFQIVFNGNTYDANSAVKFGRSYLFKNYKDSEKADRWIKKHVYRQGNGIIYLKYPSGKQRPIATVLLEELKILNQRIGGGLA